MNDVTYVPCSRSCVYSSHLHTNALGESASWRTGRAGSAPSHTGAAASCQGSGRRGRWSHDGHEAVAVEADAARGGVAGQQPHIALLVVVPYHRLVRRKVRVLPAAGEAVDDVAA